MVTMIILLPLGLLALLVLGSWLLWYFLVFRFFPGARLPSSPLLGPLLSLGLGGITTLAVGWVALPLVPDRWIRAEAQGNPAEADALVAFAFGLGPSTGRHPSPGESNRAIARWLVGHNPQKKPAIVQEGVYLALKELEVVRPGLQVDSWTFPLPHQPGVYVDTAEAALQTWALLHFQGCRRPLLVAHDLQVQRMAWSFEPFGLEEILLPNLPPMPFDAQSAQHWGTRSRTGWLLWELFFARPLALRPWSTLLLGLLALALFLATWRALGRRRSSREVLGSIPGS